MGVSHKVLIVDDNKANLLAIKSILSPLRLSVDSAMSGFEALELSKAEHYSMILLDIQMPEMDGFETLQKIREISDHEFTPVILISAVFTEDQYKIKGIQTGAVDLIPKPVNPEILRAKVQLFLDMEENRTSLNALVEELHLKNRLLSEEIEKGAQTARELQLARFRAEKANEYASQLLISMSHEIRTPVNSILGFADLITNPGITAADKEKFTQYVTNSKQNLIYIIDEILDYQKLEAGEFKVTIGPVNIYDLCAELFDMYQSFKNQTGNDEILLSFHAYKSSDNLLIQTDQQRLRQILSNLLDNAFKYTTKGFVTFGYELKGEFLEFYVKDSGIGIHPEDKEEIFNRFTRVESNQIPNIGGAGLGLSIARNLVTLLGGSIWLDSEFGSGSVFRFTIPYVLSGPEATKKVNSDTLTAKSSYNWGSHVVLIVEDEELNYFFFEECLRETGIRIIWARKGREALSLLAGHPEIKLVLMDVRLPDMNGFDTCDLIREARPGIPIILQSGYALGEMETRKLKEIDSGFISKPIDRQLLLKTISVNLGYKD